MIQETERCPECGQAMGSLAQRIRVLIEELLDEGFGEMTDLRRVLETLEEEEETP